MERVTFFIKLFSYYDERHINNNIQVTMVNLPVFIIFLTFFSYTYGQQSKQVPSTVTAAVTIDGNLKGQFTDIIHHDHMDY